MPKFKCDRHSTRKRHQKLFQKYCISLHVRRQLEKHRPELPRLGEGLNRVKESSHKFARALEPLDVRDHLVGLHSEPEVLGCLRNPFLCGCVLEKLAKSQIDFNRVELAGVISQEFRLRKLLRIERRLPTWISPSGSADEQLRHGGSALSNQRSAESAARIIPSSLRGASLSSTTSARVSGMPG